MKIKSLMLIFPHGSTSKQCDTIARLAESIVHAGVSEGGFVPNMHYDEFSEDSMQYIYGYLKDNKIIDPNGNKKHCIHGTPTERKCELCNIGG